MAVAVNMPQIGQDIEKGRILEWYVREGDAVKQGDIIATVESDKAIFEVEAFESGILLKILHQEGEEAEVFKPIAYLGQEGEVIDETTRDTEESDTNTTVPEKEEIILPEKSTRPDKLFASPTARRMARDHKLNLENITGSGPNGRIIKRDLIPLINAEEDPGIQVMDKVIPFSSMRKRIAERLTYSKQNIPHFYLFREANVTGALEARNKYNQDNHSHLSINDLIIYATATALKQFPRLNSHVEEDKLILKGQIHIGLAVAVEDGLLVPVLHDADKKNLGEISGIASDIIKKAQEGKMTGGATGTFTISNLGMYGISRFQAIINPPESAILSIGATVKKAVPGKNGIEFADFITLGLACDHRVIDGIYGAQFLEALAHELNHVKIE